jgi:hypothetical protein
MPKLGDSLRLNLQLFDGATNLYVRAYLYDANDNQLAGSPLAVPHVANGLYRADSLVMPDTPQVTAIYKVYTDAGFTTLSTNHSDAIDVYNLEADGDVTFSRDFELSGTIEENVELIASIESEDELSATIED